MLPVKSMAVIASALLSVNAKLFPIHTKLGNQPNNKTPGESPDGADGKGLSHHECFNLLRSMAPEVFADSGDEECPWEGEPKEKCNAPCFRNAAIQQFTSPVNCG